MEHKIGTKITLEVVEADSISLCCGCFFRLLCTRNRSANICNAKTRSDNKNIIYKEIKEEKK